MHRAKKVLATMLVGVLLLGGAITAYASVNDSKDPPPHVHSFSIVNSVYCRSEYKGSHPYVSGWKVDGSTGQSTPVYSTCGVSENYYKGEWKCACGASNGIAYTSREIHSSCGK